MDPTLRISGFWTFLPAALLVSVPTWPVRLIGRRERRLQQMPDPHWDMHHMDRQPPFSF